MDYTYWEVRDISHMSFAAAFAGYENIYQNIYFMVIHREKTLCELFIACMWIKTFSQMFFCVPVCVCVCVCVCGIQLIIFEV